VSASSPRDQISQLSLLLRASGEALCLCATEQRSNIDVDDSGYDVMTSICEEYSAPSQTVNNNKDVVDQSTTSNTDSKQISGKDAAQSLPFDVIGLVRYTSRMCRDKYVAGATDQGGASAEDSVSSVAVEELNDMNSALSICIMLLEYVFEVLESKAFHRSLARKIPSPQSLAHSFGNNNMRVDAPDVNSNVGTDLDEALLLFGEEVMRLLSLCSTISEHVSPQIEVTVSLGKAIHQVSLAKVASGAWDWSMDILDSLQRLMDTPSFIAILEELVQHDDASVRSRAMTILSERLTVLLDVLDYQRNRSGRKHRSRKRDANIIVERGLYRTY